MLILLDCRPLQKGEANSEKTRLIVSAVTVLAAEDEAVEWLLLTDRTHRSHKLAELADLIKNYPNVRQIAARAFNGPLGWRIWYDALIPRLIKKYRPGAVMLTGGVAIKKASVPQWVWMPVGLLKDSPPLYTSRLTDTLRRAEAVFCFSQKELAVLAGRSTMITEKPEKLFVVRPAPGAAVTRLTVEGRERVKALYTGGKEYFFTGIGAAGEEKIVQLLKAFSLFKKRQMSNLQLVLAGVATAGLREKLETYKYRQDVRVADPDKIPELLAGGYAALFPWVDAETLGGSLLDAWKAGVPALVAAGGLLEEIAEGAALVSDPADPAALAGRMMAVYKDEILRNGLVEKGNLRLTAFEPPAGPALLRMLIARHNQIIK